eukprot:3435266-Pyramimonas_sp.AAC.1
MELNCRGHSTNSRATCDQVSTRIWRRTSVSYLLIATTMRPQGCLLCLRSWKKTRHYVLDCVANGVRKNMNS